MLRVEELTKSFGGSSSRRRFRAGTHDDERVLAVDGVSFDVEQGELVTLLGPSGCGKTTTLRSVAGLERPDSGLIRVGRQQVFSGTDRVNVSPSKRDLSMVFQSYAIWPHMNVFDNVAFPLQVRRGRDKLKSGEIRSRVEKMLETVELASMIDRPATNLSGGQQQRLALARAMVTEPELVLLDEPLSNLDAKLRETLRLELKRMQRELGLTMLYVTHDQQEALVLSSVVAVMNKGKIVQAGSPREIYTKPNSGFVAEFIGTSNFIGGRVSATYGDGTMVKTSEGEVWTTSTTGMDVGAEVVLSIRPEDVELGTVLSDSEARNQWSGTVVTRGFLGDAVDHVVRLGSLEMRCRCNPSTSIAPGTEVHLAVPPDKVNMLPQGS